MSAVILDGKALALKIGENIKKEVLKLSKKPSLTVILVGDNPASEVYVSSKEKKAKELGFVSDVIKMPENTQKEELLDVIDKLNKSDTNGILLQLPLPKHLRECDFAGAILPYKDVDGFHPENMGRLLRGEKPYAISCTPKGIIRILKEYNINLEGKKVAVIGRSNIVGKPLIPLLLKENATVFSINSKTSNLSDITKMADVVISATGVKHLIKADMVKNGAVVIDVGIIRDENGKITGDVDFENVKNVASYITPTPGGIGPVTVIMLMENTLEIAKR